MDSVKERIIELLDGASEERLRAIYQFVKAILN